ncbi:glutathione S-transferase family protein [Thalassolituus sp. LLYu03]|uniref:glutathione S-transferase family protein n=1 Tax=Thalassolituus sp. LLYu03 TaxID=3421656 RepID=UPI003D295D06
MTEQTGLVLYTINMSHYSEKIRWLLDYEGIAYREAPLTPALHALPMLIKGRLWQTTVPLLQQGSVCVQDSPRIVNWLARRYALRTLPPESDIEILAIQKRFDAIGKAVARFLYLPGFAHGELIRAIWTQFSSPWEARFIQLAYPLIKPVFSLKLDINEKHVAIAEQAIDLEIRWLEQRILSGRYLVGNRFSLADIAAAALLAPLACPVQHPIYGHPLFREKMAIAAGKWEHSPALQWVRDLYASHRGVVWQSMGEVPALLDAQPGIPSGG